MFALQVNSDRKPSISRLTDDPQQKQRRIFDQAYGKALVKDSFHSFNQSTHESTRL